MSETKICCFLRTKNAYGEVTTPFGDWLMSADGSDCYWCLKGMQSNGPDGGLAALELCGEERSCFRAPGPDVPQAQKIA